MDHTPFVVGAYVVFFAVLAWDVAAPIMARRRVLTRLRAKLARDRKRSET